MKALIITALEPEFQAVAHYLTNVTEHTHETGKVYAIGRFEGEPMSWDVCLIEAGPGNDAAAVDTSHAVQYFKPDVVLFVGVAGGLKDDVRIGDVVAATDVLNYERAKIASDVEARPRGWPCSYRLVERAKAVRRNGKWHRKLGCQPKVAIAPILAGEKVWASRNPAHFRYLRQHFGDAVAVEMEGRGVLAAAHATNVHAIVIRGIMDLADEGKAAAEATGSKEMASKHAAAFAFELLATLEWPPTGREPTVQPGPAAPASPDSFPPGAAKRLEELFRAEPELAKRLLEALTGSQASLKQAVAELIRRPPDWLAEGSASAWIILGFVSLGQGDFDSASQSFQLAANRGAPVVSRWLALGAFSAKGAGQHVRVEQLLAEAKGLAPDDSFVEGMAAAIAADPNRILRIPYPDTSLDSEEGFLLGLEIGLAYSSTGKQDAALRHFQEMRRTFPDRPAVLINIASLLANRVQENASIDPNADLGQALKETLSARDLLRKRRGDSSQAVSLACRIAILQGDPHHALQLALTPPYGEATADEANSQAVLQVGADAALLSRQIPLLRELTEKMTDPFQRAILEATLAEQELGRIPIVVEAYQKALGLAKTPVQKLRALYKVAELGAWPLPEVSQLEDPEQRDLILAVSESARDFHDQAKSRLRKWQDRSASAAEILAQTYARSGDVAGALDIYSRAASRFKSPLLLVDALDLATQSARWQDAVSLAETALPLLSEHSTARDHVLGRLVEIGLMRADWETVQRYATLLFRSRPTPSVRWALITSYFNQSKLIEAWHLLRDGPELEPENEYQARVKITLKSRFDPTPSTVEQILQLADRFKDSEDVAATALQAIYTMHPAFELPTAVLGRLHAMTNDFFVRFPESQFLRKIDATDIEKMLANLQSLLSSDFEAIRDLGRKVSRGELPYGLLSSVRNKPYVSTLVGRLAGCLVAVSTDRNLLAQEVQMARDALNATVAIDTSALAVWSDLAECWPIFVGAFHSLVASDLQVKDAVFGRNESSLPSTMTIGLDPRTRELRASDVDPQQAAQESGRTRWIAERFLSLDQLVCRELTLFPKVEFARFGVWLSTLEIAGVRKIPLLADDVGLRNLARERGIPSFGTYALLQVLHDTKRVDNDQLERWTRAMVGARVVDLPFDEVRLREMAAAGGWRSESVLLAASRPTVWEEPVRTFRFFSSVFSAVAEDAPDQLPNWVYASLVGGAVRLPQLRRTEFAAEMLLTAALAAQEPVLPRVLEAVRQAAAEVGADDPLESAAVLAVRSLEPEWSPSTAAQFVVGLFQSLEAKDRLSVLGAISSPSR